MKWFALFSGLILLLVSCSQIPKMEGSGAFAEADAAQAAALLQTTDGYPGPATEPPDGYPAPPTAAPGTASPTAQQTPARTATTGPQITPFTTTPTPAVSPTPSPTSLFPPTATPTIAPTATLGPTSTPSPSPTPTQLPAWCLTQQPAPNVPAGSLEVVYTNPEGVFLFEAGSPPRQLVAVNEARWVAFSNDGQFVAYTRHFSDSNIELWVVNRDGRGDRRLVNMERFLGMANATGADAAIPFGLRWIPNSHRLAFNTYPVYAGQPLFVPSDFWMVDAVTGQQTTLPGSGGYFEFSPDGQQVAIFHSGRLDIIDLETGDRRSNVLEAYGSIPLSEASFSPRMAWEPDGSTLYAALPGEQVDFAVNAALELWRIPAGEGEAERLGEFDGYAQTVIYSPDRLTLAYWRWPFLEMDPKVLHLGGTGEPLEQIMYIEGDLMEFLNWAPGSEQFLFFLDGGQQLWLGDRCGPPELMEDMLPSSRKVAWVDDESFLYLDAYGELTIGTVEGAKDELGQLVRDFDIRR